MSSIPESWLQSATIAAIAAIVVAVIGLIGIFLKAVGDRLNARLAAQSDYLDNVIKDAASLRETAVATAKRVDDLFQSVVLARETLAECIAGRTELQAKIAVLEAKVSDLALQIVTYEKAQAIAEVTIKRLVDDAMHKETMGAVATLEANQKTMLSKLSNGEGEKEPTK